MDAQGDTHEAIYDIALPDERMVDAKTGKAPPVGSTVDLAIPTCYNTIGDAQMAAVWTDPDFDPGRRAFYYVRVLEIPTPRWARTWPVTKTSEGAASASVSGKTSKKRRYLIETNEFSDSKRLGGYASVNEVRQCPTW